MNLQQVNNAYHALTESHKGLAAQQHPMNQAIHQACTQLYTLYLFGLRIAKTKTDPFQLKNRKGLVQPELRITTLAQEFITLVGQLNLTMIRQLFCAHQFNPVVQLMLETIEQFQFAGMPRAHLEQQGHHINQFFNRIRIEYHASAFQYAYQQWGQDIVQQRQQIQAMMTGLLKKHASYRLQRVELFYRPAISPYPEQVEQHGQLLIQALQDQLWTMPWLGVLVKLDYSAGYGYRYSLVLISAQDHTVDLNHLVHLWQQDITQQIGHWIIHHNHQIPYRSAGIGLHQLGDIYQKTGRDQMMVDLVDTTYLVRPMMCQELVILMPEHPVQENPEL